jgi:hypothetical protein
MVGKRVGDQGQAGWHLGLVTMRTNVGKIWADEVEVVLFSGPATSTASCSFSTYLRLLSSLWIS